MRYFWVSGSFSFFFSFRYGVFSLSIYKQIGENYEKIVKGWTLTISTLLKLIVKERQTQGNGIFF